MPPQIPVRFPWASTKCLNSINSGLYMRSFSSTPSALALGPESPNYIEFPKPLQPSFPPKPRIKGVLPTPRNVFKTRSELPKESNEFIELSTPAPKEKQEPGKYSRDADYRLYKQRLAESRRRAFKDGVKELHSRKTATETRNAAELNQLFAERRAAAMAPPRDVDVLTQNSVSTGIRDFLEDKLPSTSRSKITSARRKAYQRKMAKHAAVREARLHDLYTNARSFIVNEEQLDEAIENVFGTEEKPVQWDTAGREVMGQDAGQMGVNGRSPWNGPIPEGVSDMLNSLKGGEGVGLAKERVGKVAEELTGGKM